MLHLSDGRRILSLVMKRKLSQPHILYLGVSLRLLQIYHGLLRDMLTSGDRQWDLEGRVLLRPLWSDKCLETSILEGLAQLYR